jgi:UDP-N-acetyl-D-mannosaminuronic acid dehydrogenase
MPGRPGAFRYGSWPPSPCGGGPTAAEPADEPHAPSLPGRLDACGNVVLTDAEHAIGECDVIALLVDHACFRAIKKTQLAGKVVYDTRGMWG